ncbi:MAG: glycosyltransferase family 4 protein [Tepidisphaerales bacterium]
MSVVGETGTDVGGQGVRVVVVQDGARLNYAVPVGLQRRGCLERVYCDFYLRRRPWNRLLAWGADRLRPGSGVRLLKRRHPELDDRFVHAPRLLSWRLARERGRFPTPEAHYVHGAQLMGEFIRRHGYGRGNALFGFVRNLDPEVAAHARGRGLVVVVDQMIATMAEELRQSRIQAERFPEWVAAAQPSDPELMQLMECRTWENAHRITCASDYVRDSLIEQGIRPDKIAVIPYPVDVRDFPYIDRMAGRPRREGVVAGCVGAVGLRKGTPYLVQVARRLPKVTFRLIGPMSLDVGKLSLPPNVQRVGVVPRHRVAEELAGMDIYFMPTTCEGSAVSILEAMATGLPVVTTPNAGSPVRHTVDGFVYPYDDLDDLVAAIETLAGDASLRQAMGRSAAERVRGLTVDRYAQALLEVFSSVLTPSAAASSAV